MERSVVHAREAGSGSKRPAARVALRCISCGERYPADKVVYQCRKCGNLLDVVYDFPAMSAEELKGIWQQRRLSNRPIDVSGVWRFRELLPFYKSEANIVTFPEGNTPLVDAPRCAQYAGLKRLQIKHQGMNPTGSFKDTGMTAGVTQARVLGQQILACSSTGNTSASMACYAARAGMLAIVLVPEGQIAMSKLAQALDFGALTLQIRGDFDNAQRLIRDLARDLGIYLLNSVNPFRLEGQKTVVAELLEQRDWVVPDRIVLPGGNLGNSSALGKGLKELCDLGFIDRLPRLTIVQAAGADPLYRTVTSPRPNDLISVHATTLATAIKIGQPVSWKKAKRAMDWTDGWCEEVDEQSIADAKAIIGRDGISCEPASATTLAAMKKLLAMGTDQMIAPDEDVVLVLTGHGLKDPDYTVRYHLDQLYENYVSQTTIVQQSHKISANYANSPIAVDQNPNEIAKVIREFAAKQGIEI